MQATDPATNPTIQTKPTPTTTTQNVVSLVLSNSRYKKSRNTGLALTLTLHLIAGIAFACFAHFFLGVAVSVVVPMALVLAVGIALCTIIAYPLYHGQFSRCKGLFRTDNKIKAIINYFILCLVIPSTLVALPFVTVPMIFNVSIVGMMGGITIPLIALAVFLMLTHLVWLAMNLYFGEGKPDTEFDQFDTTNPYTTSGQILIDVGKDKTLIAEYQSEDDVESSATPPTPITGDV